MPTLTRWYIKSTLVYLAIALILALLLALPATVNLPPLYSFYVSGLY